MVVATLVGAAIGLTAFAVRSSPWGMVAVATLPYLVAAVGALVGALAFTREDRMLWAWLSISVANVVGTLTVLVTQAPPLHTLVTAPLSDTAQAAGISGTVLLNVFTVIGLVMFGQAWRSFAPRPAWYPAATAAAFALGALVAGPSVVHGLRLVANGEGRDQWAGIISSVGDLTSITMIGPLAVTAIRMRGGSLVWPYALLTLGTLCWLAWDASTLLSGDTQMVTDLMTASLGMTFTGFAGLAHRRALA